MDVISARIQRLGLDKPGSSNRSLATLVLITCLLMRARLLSIPKEALDQLRYVRKVGKLSQDQLSSVLQQVYVKEADGSKTLLVPYMDRISKVNVKPTNYEKLAADAAHFPLLPETAKPNIDASFLRQLRAILFRIVFPSLRSKETGIIVLHSFFLVMRTVLSIAVARLDGMIVRDLVRADGKGFLKGLGLWFALAVPSTYTNSMIRHLQSKLSLRLRTRLTRYVHDLYLSSSPNLRYYRSGLEGADQYITADIEAFSESLSVLYGNILKPSLDLVLFTSQLSRSLGLRGTVMLFSTYYATVSILRAVTPAFGKLAAVEARLEGEYRAGMGRIDREAEEIAFYDAGAREKDILLTAYKRLVGHVNSIYKIRIAYEWTEDYVIKYLWSAAGYVLIAVPLLYRKAKKNRAGHGLSQLPKSDEEVAGRTEAYISNRRLLISLADAGGRLMYAYKDILELAGLTTRLYMLLSTLHNLPPMPLSSSIADSEDTFALEHIDIGIPPITDTVSIDLNAEDLELLELDKVEPLVKDLSFKLGKGEHLMITGSNGVGKTAVARVLAGLWAPLASSSPSSLRTPAREHVFVIPQRAYMVSGSLLEQVIYPDSYADYVAKGGDEAQLQAILDMVFLGYLPSREGGWRTRKEWRDVLSGGEKQRMGFARLLWRKPKFGILDECTSAVSGDVEGRLYEVSKSLGITLITISLRPSLAKYHTHLLTILGDGKGGWTLDRVGSEEERMGVEKEIKELERKLNEVDQWQERVQQLDALLKVQESDGELS